MRIKYRFRSIPFIATILLVALGVSLAQWQTRRAQEKDAIEASLQARAMQAPLALPAAETETAEFRRVLAKGRFVRGWTLYLDNRPYNGRAGLYVVTPLQLSGSNQALLVARGWVPRDPVDRKKLPPEHLPEGEVTVEGMVRHHAGRVMQLGGAEAIVPGAILQNLEIGDVAKATKLDLQPFIVEQTSDTGDGLVRDWPRPSHGSDKHRAYAFQWYALAVMAIVFFVVTGIKRGKN